MASSVQRIDLHRIGARPAIGQAQHLREPIGVAHQIGHPQRIELLEKSRTHRQRIDGPHIDVEIVFASASPPAAAWRDRNRGCGTTRRDRSRASFRARFQIGDQASASSSMVRFCAIGVGARLLSTPVMQKAVNHLRHHANGLAQISRPAQAPRSALSSAAASSSRKSKIVFIACG